MPIVKQVKSSELRQGDVVFTHGLRVQLATEPKCSEGQFGPVYSSIGIVLNVPELLDSDPGIVRYLTKGDGQHLWTIQGNDNAAWSVEDPTHPDA